MPCLHSSKSLDFKTGTWICQDCGLTLPSATRLCHHAVTKWVKGAAVCLMCDEVMEDARCHKSCPKCLGSARWVGDNGAKCDKCDTKFSVIYSHVCPKCKKSDRMEGKYTIFLKDGREDHFHCYRCDEDFSQHSVTTTSSSLFHTPPPLPPKRPIVSREPRERVGCPVCQSPVPFYGIADRGYCSDCGLSVSRLNGVVTAHSLSSSSYSSYDDKWRLKGPCPKCAKELVVYQSKGAYCSTCQDYFYPVIKADPYVLELDL